MKYNNIEPDHKAILELIEKDSSVLDLGCGDGELLYALIKEKNVRGQGIEIDNKAIYRCVARGLTVLHDDIDSGLSEYNNKSFDYIILNQSLQQVLHVETVLKDAMRIGKKVIVGFPNFAYIRARIQMFFNGRAPVIGSLPHEWYETPNLHFLSITDFKNFCRIKKIKIEKSIYLRGKKRVTLFPNLFALIGIFVISA
jgi:methionine biosynthesis protein MetW